MNGNMPSGQQPQMNGNMQNGQLPQQNGNMPNSNQNPFSNGGGNFNFR